MRGFLIRNPVYRSIAGEGVGGKSIQVEFGLTPALAAAAQSLIEELFTDPSNLKTSLVKNRQGGVDFVIDGLNWNTINRRFVGRVSSRPFSYFSTSKKSEFLREIRWMRVLLFKPSTVEGEIPDIAEYGIQYGPYGRSGGARMRKIGRGVSPYVLPDIAVPRRGRNFLEDILLNPRFQNRVENIIITSISKHLRN